MGTEIDSIEKVLRENVHDMNVISLNDKLSVDRVGFLELMDVLLDAEKAIRKVNERYKIRRETRQQNAIRNTL